MHLIHICMEVTEVRTLVLVPMDDGAECATRATAVLIVIACCTPLQKTRLGTPEKTFHGPSFRRWLEGPFCGLKKLSRKE